ncbi:hypothetical protein [Candidatus Methanodesulfokora washburnensis]|jgi:hypothetical protein|uniref:Uncharacterized protein n=1 Tax=Candidatus Methanodesulfokora washburnensis TaxID=2478471 RepID=A0A429GDS3_9CREN|nr:hypothetical protein [Candidatus Methanodesulfokores washburnensis]RSN71941.1 hypothetical protein D6D85_14875 [Candidatus Methanodesulfokores washburnensis]
MADEIRFTEVDLIFMISFDMGKNIEIKKLNELIPELRKLPDETSETIGRVVDPIYLQQSKYIQRELANLKIKVIDDDFKELKGRELICRLHLFMHSTGIAVVIAWIHLNDVDLSTDQMIKMTYELQKAKCLISKEGTRTSQNIKIRISKGDPFGPPVGSLYDYIRSNLRRLQPRVERRYPASRVYPMVFIRKYNCSCNTLEEVVENHSKELAGILTGLDEWKLYRKSATEEVLKVNLSPTEDLAFFMTVGRFLGIFSPKLDAYCDGKLDHYFRQREEDFIVPVELSVLMEMMISTYYSYLMKKMKDIERTAQPSRIVSLRKEIEKGLDEYYNIVTIEEPAITIIKHAREILRISEGVQAIKERLSVLDHYIRTRYEEEVTRKQEILTILLCVVGIPPVIEIVWEKTSSVPLVIISGFIFLMAVIIIYKYYSSIYKYCNKISSYISRLFRK